LNVSEVLDKPIIGNAVNMQYRWAVSAGQVMVRISPGVICKQPRTRC